MYFAIRRPECHIHYEEALLPMRDGLTKYAQGPESQKLDEGGPEKEELTTADVGY